MPKRSSNTQVKDLAKSILDQVTQDAAAYPGKNPAAVALGRMGGLVGGKARAEALSPKKRSAIARKAAKARWSEAPK
jgi:hypothetical protein